MPYWNCLAAQKVRNIEWLFLVGGNSSSLKM